MFFDKHVHSLMSRAPITLKFKNSKCACACYSAEKLFTDINLPPLKPDEDNSFDNFLVLDFRKWWRQVQPKN